MSFHFHKNLKMKINVYFHFSKAINDFQFNFLHGQQNNTQHVIHLLTLYLLIKYTKLDLVSDDFLPLQTKDNVKTYLMQTSLTIHFILWWCDYQLT